MKLSSKAAVLMIKKCTRCLTWDAAWKFIQMKKNADEFISSSKSFGIDAQVIGSVEEAKENSLVVTLSSGHSFSYIM